MSLLWTFSSNCFSVFLKQISSMLGYFVGWFLLEHSANNHLRNVMSHWIKQCIFSPSLELPFLPTCVHMHLSWQIFLTKHTEVITAPLPTSSSAALCKGPGRRHLQFCIFLLAQGRTTCQLAADVVEGLLASSFAVSPGVLSFFITAAVSVKCSANSWSTYIHYAFISHWFSRCARTLTSRHRAGVQLLEGGSPLVLELHEGRDGCSWGRTFMAQGMQ